VLSLSLVKYEGSGNDFLIIIDRAGDAPFSPAIAKALCDRHRGLGADGLIRLSESETGESLCFELLNADGSVAETSGNGLRCAALAAVDSGLTVTNTFPLETLIGPSIAKVGDRGGLEVLVKVTMGQAVVAEIPTPVGERRAFHVNTGNPHLVLLGERSDDLDLTTIGPSLEHAVEGGQNVEVAAVTARGQMTLAVWERGVGITQACGSGSVAAAAAAWSIDLLDNSVVVENPGGSLTVDLDGDDPENPAVALSGPARRIGEITIDLGDFPAVPSQ
jgi:diaminopimelate epimerase